jgi:hypothetical protein
MIDILTSENLEQFIDTYPTKHPQGFLSSETNVILERFNIDKDKFNETLGVNTCMIIDGEILNYHCDIELALRCMLENRDKTLEEWD